MKNGKSKLWAIFLVLLVIISVSVILLCHKDDTEQLISIKSEDELEELYNGNNYNNSHDLKFLAKCLLTSPFSIFGDYFRTSISYYSESDVISSPSIYNGKTATSNPDSSSGSNDYSKTNVQVENVDEADITKTDGEYVYSLSETNVIITDVRDPKNIKIASKIESDMSTIPSELILNGNKLIIIYETVSNSPVIIYNNYDYGYNSSNNTVVKIYNINSKENPTLAKSYTLYEPYYTSRCIGNKLYVISSGALRKNDDKIITYYSEDFANKEIGLENIKYIKDIKTRKQTLISMIDLNNVSQNVKVNSYLMNIENAYVSENNIYLLDESYTNSYPVPTISSLFGLKGILGALDNMFKVSEDSYYGMYTNIYKFNILNDGNIKYSAKAIEKGKTINQYSVDEYNNNLRIALCNSDGSRVVIFNNELKKIGESSNLAKGETMYSSRFIGNRVYLVTYRTMDPLYVIDLTNPALPTVLGELKIPGYSTYLHPYDENHIIGIGMETKEIINRNINNDIISTYASIVGMKMALFDVSNVSKPVQISQTLIGDNRTTSAILTNPKALLFSKERSLIAIPVNNYSKDFSVNSSENYDSIISSYTNESDSYISEGYLVYNINLKDGFKLKGTITHETTKDKTNNYYYYSSRLLRGLYINNNLFTVSEDMIKVNDLNTLNLINELKIREEK